MNANLIDLWWRWMTAMSWQVSLMIVAIAALCFFWRTASVRIVYLLWLLVLLKLIVPPQFGHEYSVSNNFRRYFKPALQQIPIHETEQIEVSSLPAMTGDAIPRRGRFLPSRNVHLQPKTADGKIAPLPYKRIFFFVWLLGVVGVFCFIAMRVRAFCRWLRICGEKPSVSFEETVKQLSQELGLRTPPETIIIPGNYSPCVFGWFKPKIVFSEFLLEHLSPEQLSMAIYHELTHIKRKDNIMNGLQSIVKIMCWFNPFVWLAWRKARHHCEMVVDETVAAAYNNYSKESYEQTILTLAEKGSIQPLPAMVGIIEPRTFMFRRISRLLDAASIKVGRGRSIVNWCLLAIFAISFIPMGMTQPKEAVLEKRPFPEVLNEMQIQYVNWTNERFKGSFEGSQYANLSDSTKTEMEEIWLATLEEEESQKYRSAMSALVAIRSKRAIKPLLRIAAERREKNNSYRWIAVRALGIIGDDSVVPELIHLIYHYNQNTRIWAQISLARLTGVNFGYDWQKWGEWWNKQEKTPKFSPTMITWTTKYVEYADPKKQKQGDMKAFGRPKTKPNR